MEGPIRRKIDTGVRGLCDIINRSCIAQTVFSCDGHEEYADEVFFGYESPLFPSPIVLPGTRSNSPAYVDLIPAQRRDQAFELMMFLADETARLRYTDSTPSFKFEFEPAGRLHIEFPHEYAVRDCVRTT